MHFSHLSFQITSQHIDSVICLGHKADAWPALAHVDTISEGKHESSERLTILGVACDQTILLEACNQQDLCSCRQHIRVSSTMSFKVKLHKQANLLLHFHQPLTTTAYSQSGSQSHLHVSPQSHPQSPSSTSSHSALA